MPPSLFIKRQAVLYPKHNVDPAMKIAKRDGTAAMIVLYLILVGLTFQINLVEYACRHPPYDAGRHPHRLEPAFPPSSTSSPSSGHPFPSPKLMAERSSNLIINF